MCDLEGSMGEHLMRSEIKEKNDSCGVSFQNDSIIASAKELSTDFEDDFDNDRNVSGDEETLDNDIRENNKNSLVKKKCLNKESNANDKHNQLSETQISTVGIEKESNQTSDEEAEGLVLVDGKPSIKVENKIRKILGLNPVEKCSQDLETLVEDAKLVGKKSKKRKRDADSFLPFKIKMKGLPETSPDKMPHICELCDKKFKFKSDLSLHMMQHRGENPFVCNLCGKSFIRASVLRRHEMVHSGERPHSCEFCKKKFGRLENLKAHMMLHTGERPYACKECSMTFTHLSTLRSHMQVHTGVKPHECSVCEHKFTQLSSLRAHMVLHTGTKPYKCEVCENSFSFQGALKRHMLIHTGERVHECSYCKKMFKRLSTLREHIVLHTGERPFVCEVCKQTFTQASSLRRHSVVHKEKKPFECEICKKAFTQKGTLTKHMEKHDETTSNQGLLSKKGRGGKNLATATAKRKIKQEIMSEKEDKSKTDEENSENENIEENTYSAMDEKVMADRDEMNDQVTDNDAQTKATKIKIKQETESDDDKVI